MLPRGVSRAVRCQTRADWVGVRGESHRARGSSGRRECTVPLNHCQAATSLARTRYGSPTSLRSLQSPATDFKLPSQQVAAIFGRSAEANLFPIVLEIVLIYTAFFCSGLLRGRDACEAQQYVIQNDRSELHLADGTSVIETIDAHIPQLGSKNPVVPPMIRAAPQRVRLHDRGGVIRP